jgi:hypothetical protein
MKSNPIYVIASVLLVAATAATLGWIFGLRLETGGLYPEYSTLRADPLGAKALFLSLGRLDGVKAERRLREFELAPVSGEGRSLFYLAVDPDELEDVPENIVRAWEKFAKEGGRVVFTFTPDSFRAGEYNASGRRPRRSRSKPANSQTPPGEKTLRMAFEWKIPWDRATNAVLGARRRAVRSDSAPTAFLPKEISWRSEMVFSAPEDVWTPIYRVDEQPVVVSRALGKGSLVFCSDSFFLSNEGLRNEPQPGLLSWLIGSAREVLFDETHLGVREDPGIASLLRRYRLHGLVISLIIIATLFAWKNVAAFPPKSVIKPADDDMVAGGDSLSGLASLLRRSIPREKLAKICFEEWAGSPDAKLVPRERRERAAEALRQFEMTLESQRNDLEFYQKISRLLRERPGKPARNS